MDPITDAAHCGDFREVPHAARILAALQRHSLAIAILLVALATARIVSTYHVFSRTLDEPAHVDCGMEWLAHGTYQREPQHPPLARVMTALGPYLSGLRLPDVPDADGENALMFAQGEKILDSGRTHDLPLTLARLGVLPFFWVACAVVYAWGVRYFSRATAVVAVGLFTFLPPVLAHAGLATTDMALTAFLGAFFLCGLIWFQQPTRRHAILWGAATGLMILSKFSCVVFAPLAVECTALWCLVTHRPRMAQVKSMLRARAASLGLAALVAFLVVWAGYRFSFGKVFFANWKLPAPELFAGLDELMIHNMMGHLSYLFGVPRIGGFWYFYEVALAVKTPLAFLVLLAAGTLVVSRLRSAVRHWYAPLAFSLGILAVGVFSHINIGIRHVLPVYAGFSLVAAAAVVYAWERRSLWMNLLVAALLLWMAVSSAMAHPDYLAYFNELAGKEPENILVDSDLDWGQDMKRLGARLRELHAPSVALGAMGKDTDQYGFPPYSNIHLDAPDPGWNAVSIYLWKVYRLGLLDRHPEHKTWPDRYMEMRGQPGVPMPERVGKSILLWYIPPQLPPPAH